MNLTYRKITLRDRDQAKRLALLAYGQFASLLADGWTKMQTNLGNIENWENIIRGSTGFACFDGDKLVGMAYLIASGNPWDIFEAEWSYIRMVAVDPSYGGRGIARALTQSCVEQAKETGERTIALHTSEFMDAARHIYESMGFRILRPLEPRFGKKYWLYTLDLKP